jgi:hypothetical protein
VTTNLSAPSPVPSFRSPAPYLRSPAPSFPSPAPAFPLPLPLPPSLSVILAISLSVLLLRPAPARAQGPDIREPARRFVALDVDGGAARELSPARWRAFGRVGAGLGHFDGQRLLSATLEVGAHGASRTTVGLGAQIVSVQTGLGATATVLRDLGDGGFGAGLGIGFSVLQVQAQVFQKGPATRALTLFLRAPLGLLFQLWRERAQQHAFRARLPCTSYGAAASVQTRPAPAGLHT